MQKHAKKIYPQGNAALIVCDNCGKSKRIDITRLAPTKHHFRVRCICKSIFYISIEKRKYYRRPTYLIGKYLNGSKSNIVRDITIRDISRGGVGFEVYADAAIQVDDILSIKFTLDDAQKTEVHKKVTVKHTKDRFVGGEFCDFGMFDRELGFYCMAG